MLHCLHVKPRHLLCYRHSLRVLLSVTAKWAVWNYGSVVPALSLHLRLNLEGAFNTPSTRGVRRSVSDVRRERSHAAIIPASRYVYLLPSAVSLQSVKTRGANRPFPSWTTHRTPTTKWGYGYEGGKKQKK